MGCILHKCIFKFNYAVYFRRSNIRSTNNIELNTPSRSGETLHA